MSSNVPSPTPKTCQKNTLDEITNKVFNELLQRRVDAHSRDFVLPQQVHSSNNNNNNQQTQKRLSDFEETAARSDDLGSETSFDVLNRLRPGETPVPKSRTFIAVNKNRKMSGPPVLCTAPSSQIIMNGAGVSNESKRPLIAKWKTGAKLQTTTANSDKNGRSSSLKSIYSPFFTHKIN